MTETGSLVVVVTGLSGAGKSTAVHALEDLGFFCVDNLPTPVVEDTLKAFADGGVRRIALGIDIRVRGFLDDATRVIDKIAKSQHELSVLFLDANDETVLRRFSSTRRPHPLSTTLELGAEGAATAVLDGIRLERELLAPLRARATVVIDTTRLSVHELRRAIVAHYGPGASALPRMHTRFISFGYKYGAPVDADILLDVRFLQNPYFVTTLRDLPGTHAEIVRYVLDNSECADFLRLSSALLEFVLPRFEREGKSYATIGIGCTGGRHRSVVIAERLAEDLEGRLGLAIDVVHRDVERLNSEDSISHPGFVGGRPRAGGDKA
jgi:UPF0042 nucleotide-binding protein